MSGVALFAGAHPDDVELFAGGTAARLARLGHRVVIADLTRGERASNGTPEERAREAAAAAERLGAERRTLALPDAGLDPYDAAQVRAVVELVRTVRPDLLVAPAALGRHPDHEAASALLRRAVFFAGLRNADADGDPHRPGTVWHYPMRVAVQPTQLVPLDAVDVAAKYDAIAAHGSQVAPPASGAATLVGHPAFTDSLRARDAHWGAFAGVAAAEPFCSARLPVVDDPVAWALAHPGADVHWFTEGGR